MTYNFEVICLGDLYVKTAIYIDRYYISLAEIEDFHCYGNVCYREIRHVEVLITLSHSIFIEVPFQLTNFWFDFTKSFHHDLLTFAIQMKYICKLDKAYSQHK